jgi:hypothetical protein
MRNLHQYYSSRTNEEYKDNIRNLGYRGQLQNVHMQFIIQNRHLYYAARYCEGYFDEPIIIQGYNTRYTISDFIGVVEGDMYGGVIRGYGMMPDVTYYDNVNFVYYFGFNDKNNPKDLLYDAAVKRMRMLKERPAQDKEKTKKNDIYFAYTIPRKFLKRGVLMFVNNIGKPKIYNIKGVK